MKLEGVASSDVSILFKINNTLIEVIRELLLDFIK